MMYIREARKFLRSIKLEVLIEWSSFLVFMVFLFLVNNNNNLLFHTSIEIFINFIFILVFVFAFNTYSVNKNNFLLILGTGYFFVAILGISHLLTFTGMPFLSSTDGLKVTTQLWIASRYMGVFTCLIAVVFMLKPNKKVNAYTLYITYFCITAFLLLSIFEFNIFPDCYVINVGLTPFKVISEYILCIGFLGIAVIFAKLSKNMDRYLFVCLEIFLIFSGISEMFFTRYIVVYEWTNVAGHIVTLIAAYFMYKGVVETGLKKPYTLINYDLNVAGNKLKQFEEIVFRNEQCFNMIINNSDSAIFVVSDNKFVFANKKTAELLAIENAEDIIGLDLERVMVDEFRNSAYARINNAIFNKGSVPFTESKLLRLDGQIIDIEVTNRFCMYNEKPSAMVMFRDITSRKQIQLLENSILENKKLINKTTELNKMMIEFFF